MRALASRLKEQGDLVRVGNSRSGMCLIRLRSGMVTPWFCSTFTPTNNRIIGCRRPVGGAWAALSPANRQA